MKRPPIRVLELDGTAESRGRHHGRLYASEIREYAADRLRLIEAGDWAGRAFSPADARELAETMLSAHEVFDKELYREFTSMCTAAGLTPAEGVIVGGFTDFVDAVRAQLETALPPTLSEDDCTALLLPSTQTARSAILAQTWDMHDTATNHVLMLHLQRSNQPAALVFTTTGCLGQVGMNEEGLCVGINNLSSIDGQVGVTWPFVVRRMLAASTASEALAILATVPLAGAHNYLILDRDGSGYNVEATPTTRAVTTLAEDPLTHTNHALDPQVVAMESDKAPALLASSQTRLRIAREMLACERIGIDDAMQLLREPTAICQRARAPYNIESSGAIVMAPATRELWACWGPPAENEFERFQFHNNATFGRHTSKAPGT